MQNRQKGLWNESGSLHNDGDDGRYDKYWSKFATCKHAGKIPIVQDNKRNIKVFGGSGSTIEPRDFNLILDVGRVFTYKGQARVKGAEPYATELNALCPTLPPIVEFDWPDMEHPGVNLNFWRKFWSLIPNDTNLLVTCVGGHGRTGTAIAALMVSNGYTPLSAVTHIRNVYCENAIETLTQEKYLCYLWKLELIDRGLDISEAEKQKQLQEKELEKLFRAAVYNKPTIFNVEKESKKNNEEDYEKVIEAIESYMCDNCGDPVDDGVMFDEILLPIGMSPTNGKVAVLCTSCFTMINEALDGLIKPEDIKVKITPINES